MSITRITNNNSSDSTTTIKTQEKNRKSNKRKYDAFINSDENQSKKFNERHQEKSQKFNDEILSEKTEAVSFHNAQAEVILKELQQKLNDNLVKRSAEITLINTVANKEKLELLNQIARLKELKKIYNIYLSNLTEGNNNLKLINQTLKNEILNSQKSMADSEKKIYAQHENNRISVMKVDNLHLEFENIMQQNASLDFQTKRLTSENNQRVQEILALESQLSMADVGDKRTIAEDSATSTNIIDLTNQSKTQENPIYFPISSTSLINSNLNKQENTIVLNQRQEPLQQPQSNTAPLSFIYPTVNNRDNQHIIIQPNLPFHFQVDNVDEIADQNTYNLKR